MLHILYEEYKKHKALIWIYMGLCVFLSVFCGAYLQEWFSIHAYASTTTLTEGETLSTLTKEIMGSTISSVAGSYSSVVAISCEPFTALLFLGLIENINTLCGSPLDMISTPAGNPIVLLVVSIFFVASKLMKSNESTQVFGIVTLGELEKYLGLVFILVLGILNVTGLSAKAAAAVAYAASPGTMATAGADWVTVLSVVWSIIFSVLSVIVFFIMKTVMSGLEVIQMSLSFVPGSALFFEVAKSLFAVFLVTINIICPPLGIAFNIIVFIIGCILFKICYKATRYFELIYVRPLLKRIRGFDPHISLISKKYPKKLKKYCETNQMDYQMAIPVYPLKYIGEEKVKKYDRWWLVCDKTTNAYIKKKVGKNKARRMDWNSSCQQPVYIRKGLWFYEIFSYIPHPDNLAKKYPKKEFSFAFSMEYFYRINDILELTGYEDYSLIQEAKKLIKRQQREEKRMLKKEALLQKLDNWKQKRLEKQSDKQEY